MERKLGAGGMGAVYVAVQEPLGRAVALKVILGAAAGDPQIVERFRREARLVSSLVHPHIVTLHDFGATDAGVGVPVDLVLARSLFERGCSRGDDDGCFEVGLVEKRLAAEEFVSGSMPYSEFMERQTALVASSIGRWKDACRRMHMRSCEHLAAELPDVFAELERERADAAPKELPMRAVPVAGAPARGSDSAGVTVVVFADFQDPHSKRVAPTLNELLLRHPDELRIVFRHLPLSMHAAARNAAIAAVCAQGDEAQSFEFWRAHDVLFDASPRRGARASGAGVGLLRASRARARSALNRCSNRTVSAVARSRTGQESSLPNSS
ncbi:MAG: thioredoxin domain-containing protein [Deltaproteobacteria bacterium]|nr:thioredoxin domain-containing protein [Deltaproteobacteria bacterium]